MSALVTTTKGQFNPFCPRRLHRRAVCLSAAALILSPPAFAALTDYNLNADASSVGFAFSLAGTHQTGTIPVRSADIEIDPDNLERSRVDVILDANNARTGFAFARAVMLGPDVLAAKSYPTIRFASTHVALGPGRRLSDGAVITGDLTLRSVTRPILLRASLYRKRGTAPTDLRELSFHLRGSLSRSAFGASGYRDLVADTVTLDIRAVITRAT